MPQNIGRIVSLSRYPVKSMLGEDLNASEMTDRGLLGDRSYALIDIETGKIASAKNPLKWEKLFDCRAAYLESPRNGMNPPAVKIILPDGSIVQSDAGNAEKILSSLFGRPVKLASVAPSSPALEEYWPDIEGLAHREKVTDESIAMGSPTGSFFDYAVVHLLTTATLERLSELYPNGRFEARRFRPNLVMESAEREKEFIENRWIGKEIRIGDAVRLKITDPCPRCVMTTLPQGDLPKDPGILRTAAKNNKVIGGEMLGADGVYSASVGVYARVMQTGTVRRGDPVFMAD